MKSNKKLIILSLFLIIFILSLFNSSEINENQTHEGQSTEIEEINELKSSDYWNLSATPIYIDDTDPLNDWSVAAGNLWCSGSGTWGDPYVLENITINSGFIPCITIIHSSKPFIINNCTLNNSFAFGGAITLENTSNAIISNTKASVSTYGIYMNYSTNNTIFDNYFYDNFMHGVYMCNNSDDNILFGNQIINNTWGITLDGTIEGCDNNTIHLYNNITKNENGMIIMNSNSTKISNTYIHNNTGIGIIINGTSGFNNVSWCNEFIGNGLHALDNGTNSNWNESYSILSLFPELANFWDNYTGMDTNDDLIGDTPHDIVGTAGSKDNHPRWNDGLDVTNLSEICIDELGSGDYTWEEAAEKPWCRGSGTWSDPYIIENITIDLFGYYYCLEIRNSDKYFIIRNCSFTNFEPTLDWGMNGLNLINTSNGTIINNNCSSIGTYGIYIYGGSNNTIKNNTVTYNGGGMYIKYSFNNTLSENNVSYNYRDGIRIEYTNNTLISNNTANNNVDFGLNVFYAFNLTVVYNIANNNGYCGIYIDTIFTTFIFDWNFFCNNTANNNMVFGMLLLGVTDIEVVDNAMNNNNDTGMLISNYRLISLGYQFILRNNASFNARKGIYILDSIDFVLLENNASFNGEYGMYLDSCIDLYLSNNSFTYNVLSGLYLIHSNSSDIVRNNFSHNFGGGIYLFNSHGNDIYENIIENHNESYKFYRLTNYQPLRCQHFEDPYTNRKIYTRAQQLITDTDMPFLQDPLYGGSSNFLFDPNRMYNINPVGITDWDDYYDDGLFESQLRRSNSYEVITNDFADNYFDDDEDLIGGTTGIITGAIFDAVQTPTDRTGPFVNTPHSDLIWRVYQDGPPSILYWGPTYDYFRYGHKEYYIGMSLPNGNRAMFSQNFTFDPSLFLTGSDDIEEVTLSISYKYLDPYYSANTSYLMFAWFDDGPGEYDYNTFGNVPAFNNRFGWALTNPEKPTWNHFEVDLTNTFKNRLDTFLGSFDPDLLKGEVSFAGWGTDSSNDFRIAFDDILFNIKYKDYMEPSNNGNGIYLEQSTQNDIRENEVCNNSYAGIHLYQSNNNDIENNTVSNNSVYGIYVLNSNDNEIYNNDAFFNNLSGIALKLAMGNNLTENNANYNFGPGIYLDNCGYSIVLNNNLSYNINGTLPGAGIYLNTCNDSHVIGNNASYNQDLGIKLDYCSLNNVSVNIFSFNIMGIELYDNGENLFTENKINNNTVYQINIILSNDNLFYNNNISGYQTTPINITDGNNYWNNSVIGNYYSGLFGINDTDDDGIGDNPVLVFPFPVKGIYEWDWHPIWSDGDDPPIIIIVSPAPNDTFQEDSPTFNITIADLLLNKTWYTLDGGLNNYTFWGFSVKINQTVWDTVPIGFVIIEFYANDSAGLIGFVDINISKIIFPPSIHVTSPINGTVVNATAPTFTLEISGIINKTWYTLDGGQTNYTFSGLTVQINQTAWENAGQGSVIFRFYANNTVGLIGFVDADITKYIPPPPDPPAPPDDGEPEQTGIPGYDATVLLITIFGITILLYYRKYKFK